MEKSITNIKLQRPGNTETSLVMSNRLISSGIVASSFGLEHKYINFLYSTSGFYDKSIKGSYFDIDYTKAINSDHYQKWLKDYNDSLCNSDYLHPLIDRAEFRDYVPNIIEWIKTLNVGCCSEINRIFGTDFDICSSKKIAMYQGYWWNYPVLFPFLENQRVLVVNSFDGLIKQQFESKNLSKIHPGFPDMRDLLTVKTPFTFFNSGPHDNYQQTIEYIWSEILNLKDKFDTALISCGPMGCILTDKVHKLNKNAIYMGSGLQKLFGISVKDPKNKYWISEIPTEYIPEGYEKIEGGRYWR